jgi:hypothetical protein
LLRSQQDDLRVVTPYRVSDDDIVAYESRIGAFLAKAGLRPRAVELATPTQ